MLYTEKNNQKKHLLITALGMHAKESAYIFKEKTYSAKLSPIALMHLLPGELRPRRVVALCTPEAGEKTFPILQEGVNVPVELVPIPAGKSKDELWDILRIILAQIPAGSRVTLELTQGFRSSPFLFFTAALFLRALRGVEVDAVYYGMLQEIGPKNEDNQIISSIVDLRPILEMVEWFYATRMFRETGQAHLLSQRLAQFERPPRDAMAGHEERVEYGKVKGLREGIERFSLQYSQALPLEMGVQAGNLAKRLHNPVPEHLKGEMPVADELFQAIHDFIAPFVLDMPSRSYKEELELSLAELKRQARVIDTYLVRGDANYALGLIREWMVTAVLWHQGITAPESWIEPKGKNGREYAERRLGVLRYLAKEHKHVLLENEAWLARHWNQLSDFRNMLAHHGFRKGESFITSSRIWEIRNAWEELKNSLETPEKWNVDVAGGGGRLLISPLGLSKGLLFSAVSLVEPDSLLVLTSKEAAPHIDDICSRAGWAGEKLPVYVINDPHSGFHETGEILKNAAPYLLKADQIVLNITGGTTAMQYMVQRLGKHAQQMGRDVKQVALVDRRDPVEQRENPFVLGELIELDHEPGKDPDD